MDPDRFLMMRIASHRAETEVETQVEEEDEMETRESESTSSTTEVEKSQGEEAEKSKLGRRHLNAWRKSSLPQLLLHPKRLADSSTNLTEEKDDQHADGIARHPSFVKLGKVLGSLFQKKEDAALNMQAAEAASLTYADNPLFRGLPQSGLVEEDIIEMEEEKND